MTNHPHFADTWRAAFVDTSGASFRGLVSPGVVLEASVLAAPVTGADVVWDTLRCSGALYDALSFARETAGEDLVVLEWEARALGLDIGGVTVLSLDPDGCVAHIALHHRPLGAVEAFAAALAEQRDR